MFSRDTKILLKRIRIMFFDRKTLSGNISNFKGKSPVRMYKNRDIIIEKGLEKTNFQHRNSSEGEKLTPNHSKKDSRLTYHIAELATLL